MSKHTCRECKTSDGVIAKFFLGDTVENLKEDVKDVKKDWVTTMKLMYETQELVIKQEESVKQTLESLSEKMDHVLAFKKDLNEIKGSLRTIHIKCDENSLTSIKNNVHLDRLINDLNAKGVTTIDPTDLGVANFR